MIKISYPVTSEAKQAITEYPMIDERFKLPKTGRSGYEIVRLLSNTHYEHILQQLEFINHWLPVSGEIGGRVLKAKHPFGFTQSMAELYLFAHLHERKCNVEALKPVGGKNCPDMKAKFDDITVMIEVFTPVDFMGFQLFKQYIPMVLKYLNVDCGFHLCVHVNAIRDYSDCDQKAAFYPYTVPEENSVHEWLENFSKCAADWLMKPDPNLELVMPGPGGKVDVIVRLIESSNNSADRIVRMRSATRSTDTKLFFQVGTAADTKGTQWGRKLCGKLSDEQCGPPTDGVIRMLVVNFSMADTGWPHFISEEFFTIRFRETIELLAGQNKHYDVVLPAQLGINCCFGHPVWLAEQLITHGTQFIAKAELDKQCQPEQGYTPLTLPTEPDDQWLP